MLKEIHEQPRGGPRHPARPDFAAGGLRRLHLDELRSTNASSAASTRSSSSPAAPPARRAWSASSRSSTGPASRSRSRSASEFRYRDPILDHHTLVIASPSPARPPTRSPAMQPRPQTSGAPVIALCNVVGSTARPRGRRGALHPRRPGDRRRLDQGVHHPARRLPAARPLPRASSGAMYRRDRGHPRTRLQQIPEAITAGRSSSTRRSGARRALPRHPDYTVPRPRHQLPDRPTRGRSSSRRSATSTPRATPPAR
jgi:hypothetical protein